MSRPSAILSMVGVAIVVIACGKRTFAPPAPQASASAAAVSTTPPPEPEPEPEELSETTPLGPLATTCDGVSLVLAWVRQRPDGDGIDTILELRNGSSAYVPVALPAEGSSRGTRNPTLTYELTPNDVAPPSVGCGNHNRASAKDFVVLAPGAKKRLGWDDPPTPARPGRYTLRTTYRNDPQSAENRLGDNTTGPETDKLVARARRTVPCTLTSNPFSFTYEAKTAPKNKR